MWAPHDVFASAESWQRSLKAETVRRDLRPDDAIFVLDDGRPLTAEVYRKVWRQARAAVLQAHEIDSPLGRHVSALRDARIAAWLKDGDQTAGNILAVAGCAGMSPPRLAERFADCLRNRHGTKPLGIDSKLP